MRLHWSNSWRNSQNSTRNREKFFCLIMASCETYFLKLAKINIRRSRNKEMKVSLFLKDHGVDIRTLNKLCSIFRIILYVQDRPNDRALCVVMLFWYRWYVLFYQYWQWFHRSSFKGLSNINKHFNYLHSSSISHKNYSVK